MRLMLQKGAIWGLIALFLTNQIAGNTSDFKMNVIKHIILYVSRKIFTYLSDRLGDSYRQEKGLSPCTFNFTRVLTDCMILTIGKQERL